MGRARVDDATRAAMADSGHPIREEVEYLGVGPKDPTTGRRQDVRRMTPREKLDHSMKPKRDHGGWLCHAKPYDSSSFIYCTGGNSADWFRQRGIIRLAPLDLMGPRNDVGPYLAPLADIMRERHSESGDEKFVQMAALLDEAAERTKQNEQMVKLKAAIPKPSLEEKLTAIQTQGQAAAIEGIGEKLAQAVAAIPGQVVGAIAEATSGEDADETDEPKRRPGRPRKDGT